jgi:hypothetical protein
VSEMRCKFLLANERAVITCMLSSASAYLSNQAASKAPLRRYMCSLVAIGVAL